MHVSCQYCSLYNLMSIPASDGASQVVVHGPPPRTITLRTLRTGHSTHNFEISGCRTHAYHSNTTTSAWSSKNISKGNAEDTYIFLKNPLISRFSLQKTPFLLRAPGAPWSSRWWFPRPHTSWTNSWRPMAARTRAMRRPKVDAGMDWRWPGRVSSSTAGMGIEKYD